MIRESYDLDNAPMLIRALKQKQDAVVRTAILEALQGRNAPEARAFLDKQRERELQRAREQLSR